MRVESATDKLFYSTVPVICRDTKGDVVSKGTGLLFNYKRDNEDFRFLVSNKHVFNGGPKISILINKGSNGPLGESFELELSSAFHGHPDPSVDVAIIAIDKDLCNSEEPYFCHFVSEEVIPTEEQLNKLDSIESVVFIGCPNGLYDSFNSLPIARTGTTATPLMVDYQGAPTFLVDASVFPGSSGSPVFILNLGFYREGNSCYMGKNRIYFLGIIGSVKIKQTNYPTIPVPTSFALVTPVHDYLDLGIVYKSRTIIETIRDYLKQRTRP